MRIEKGLKPWACCSTDKAREVLATFCYLDAEKKLLVATDGRMLSKLAVELDAEDVSGLVPVAALKEAARVKSMFYVDCSRPDAVKLLDGRTFPRGEASRFPNWEQVVPTFASERRPVVRVQFNPELLYALFAAMGADERQGAVLEFAVDEENDAAQGPMLVHCGAASGVLMPMRIASRAPERGDDVEADHAAALLAPEAAR